MPDRFDDIRADAACCAREYDTDKEKDSSLTDDWKAGKLKCGYFFLRLLNDHIMVGFFDGISFSCCQDFGIREIIAPCNYDHFVELTEKVEQLKDKVEWEIGKNKALEKQLTGAKERIKKGRKALKLMCDSNDKLRALLKECDGCVRSLRARGVSDCNGSTLIDLLTRIDAAIGESEASDETC